jgi:hypothetical protein
MTDTYAPVVRDRATERERCEHDIPGYREERHHPTWREIRDKFLVDPEVAQSFDDLRKHLPDRTDYPVPADFTAS